jgi:hypothetical protein
MIEHAKVDFSPQKTGKILFQMIFFILVILMFFPFLPSGEWPFSCRKDDPSKTDF